MAKKDTMVIGSNSALDIARRVATQESLILGGRNSRRNRMFGIPMIPNQSTKTKHIPENNQLKQNRQGRQEGQRGQRGQRGQGEAVENTNKLVVEAPVLDESDFQQEVSESASFFTSNIADLKQLVNEVTEQSEKLDQLKQKEKQVQKKNTTNKKENIMKDQINTEGHINATNMENGEIGQDSISLNVKTINTSMLQSDKEFQRDINHALVNKIANQFDISKLGAITVARLTDRGNKLVVLDGQHRVAGIKLRNNGADIDIDCFVFDMTVQQAHDWVGNQTKNRRNHTSTFLFNQRAQGFGSIEHDIIEVLKEFDIEISDKVDVNTTNVVSQLIKIANYNIDELRATYRIINGVFDDCDISTEIGRKTYKDRNKAVSVEAFGKLVHVYGGLYNETEMISYLREAKLPSDKSKKMTIEAYIGAARNDMDNSLKRGTVSTFMARLFVKEYNKHKRKNNRLDPDVLFK